MSASKKIEIFGATAVPDHHGTATESGTVKANVSVIPSYIGDVDAEIKVSIPASVSSAKAKGHYRVSVKTKTGAVLGKAEGNMQNGMTNLATIKIFNDAGASALLAAPAAGKIAVKANSDVFDGVGGTIEIELSGKTVGAGLKPSIALGFDGAPAEAQSAFASNFDGNGQHNETIGLRITDDTYVPVVTGPFCVKRVGPPPVPPAGAGSFNFGVVLETSVQSEALKLSSGGAGMIDFILDEGATDFVITKIASGHISIKYPTGKFMSQAIVALNDWAAIELPNAQLTPLPPCPAGYHPQIVSRAIFGGELTSEGGGPADMALLDGYTVVVAEVCDPWVCIIDEVLPE